MLSDYIRAVSAKQSLKIKDNFELQAFDDITPEIMEEGENYPEHIEIFAAVKIFYEGTLPDSYKTINLVISDWVIEHIEKLTEVIHEKLKKHFSEMYPQSDTSGVTSEDTAVWEDQLEYMPRIDEEEKSMIIEIELVLEAELDEEKKEEKEKK